MANPKDTLDWLKELNPQQRAAVTHGDGPLLVVAGAGTGKTKTLAYRVAYLISQGTDPSRILLLTFTRRAAHEMLRRASSIAARGTSATGRVWGGTFHAISNRLLRTHHKAAGLRQDFTVMDQGDAEDMMNLIRHDLGLHKAEKRFPRKRTCLSIYSRCLNASEDLETVLQSEYPWCLEWKSEFRELFKRYVDRKQKTNVLDFDDLLLYWLHLLSDPRLAPELSQQFDYVLVDEYQDTNKLQAGILRGMCSEHSNLMVVGDDAQSIYRFRGATVRNMLDFPEQFSGAKVITLEQNYRSVTPILDTANRLIAEAAEQYTKDLWSDRPSHQMPKLVTCKDEAQQDEFVVERILQHYEEGIPLRRQAVLFRTAYLSTSLELELTRRNIPYHKYGGLRFMEAAHVKDLISILRLLENPLDELAWFRVLQLMDGVGPGTAAKIMGHVLEHHGDPRSVSSFKGPAAAQDELKAFCAMVEDVAPMGVKEPAIQLERIRKFYDKLLKKTYDNPYARERDLISLEQIASGYTSRRKFLVDLQLDPPTSTSDLAGPPVKDEDYLILSTIHSSKGGEWDVVYLIHATDGFLPSDLAAGSPEELEEERRLTYVALTRARDFLYVSRPLRYYHRWYGLSNGHDYMQLCRYFTRQVLPTLETMNLTQPERFDREDESFPEPAMDISERIRQMWEEGEVPL
jgi:DNA helicase II / ATP-dependent DNA helicase PcrA